MRCRGACLKRRGPGVRALQALLVCPPVRPADPEDLALPVTDICLQQVKVCDGDRYAALIRQARRSCEERRRRHVLWATEDLRCQFSVAALRPQKRHDPRATGELRDALDALISFASGYTGLDLTPPLTRPTPFRHVASYLRGYSGDRGVEALRAWLEQEALRLPGVPVSSLPLTSRTPQPGQIVVTLSEGRLVHLCVWLAPYFPMLLGSDLRRRGDAPSAREKPQGPQGRQGPQGPQV